MSRLTECAVLTMLILAMPLNGSAQPPAADVESREPDTSGETDGGEEDEDSGALINEGLVIEEDRGSPEEGQSDDDRFVPTTRISEDLSVSFPVDI